MSLFTPHLLVDGKSGLQSPTRPVVVMRLAEFSQDDRAVFIGPDLMTSQEIDELVNRLIDDAESFRRLAKYELDLANTRANRG